MIRNPKSIRPWQLVLEPLVGYLSLAEHLFENGQDFAEPFNFGPRESDAQPVEWIVDRLVKYWGADAKWELAAGEQPHEAYYLKLDASNIAQRGLDGPPRTDLSTALEWIVDWYNPGAAATMFGRFRSGRS